MRNQKQALNPIEHVNGHPARFFKIMTDEFWEINRRGERTKKKRIRHLYRVFVNKKWRWKSFDPTTKRQYNA